MVAFNEQDHVAGLVEAVRRQEGIGDIRLETILVDGGSSDNTVAHARAAGYDHIIDAPGDNIPICRNKGLARATGEWIAYIDADCEAAPGWLTTARRFLENNDALVIGWPVEPPRPGTWVQRVWHTHWSTKNARRDDWKGEEVISEDGFRLLTTRNMVMHKSVAEQMNGFDENLSTGEDTDFVFRAYHAGIPTLGVPGMRMIHHGEPATLRAFYKQQTWHANRNSYKRILATAGGKSGGNAPKFTVLYLATGIVFDVGLLTALFTSNPWWLVALLPWLGLITGPAALIGLKAGRPHHIPGLAVLYAVYGWARVLDLLGCYKEKRSWKS